MPSDLFTVPDPSSGREVFTFVGSAAALGTNTQVHQEKLLSAGGQEDTDQRVIDLQRERERRLRARRNEGQRSQLRAKARLDSDSPDTAGHLTLLQSWYALARSGISPRNFGRLQNAASQFEGMVGHEAPETLNRAIRLFLTFWAAIKQGNQEPELYVAASGRLQAVWSHQNGWYLVIEFGGDDKLFWAMYQDEYIVEGQQSTATIAELAKNLKALASKPLRWCC